MRILWLTLFLCPLSAFGWGAVGHRLIAENAAALVGAKTLSRCGLTAQELIDHVNDPDQIWRQQRVKHPREAQAHFFHVDRQPAEWRNRTEAADVSQGFLVYRIVRYFEEAKKARASSKSDVLHERIYGLAHYLGDLTQPLHLHHDYDGIEAGLPGLHSQFETKMVGRYVGELDRAVGVEIAQEGVPAAWGMVPFKDLIFDTAVQSHAKAAELFAASRPALQAQHSRKTGRDSERFVKKVLYQRTGVLASHQLTLGARLVARVLNEVCR